MSRGARHTPQTVCFTGSSLVLISLVGLAEETGEPGSSDWVCLGEFHLPGGAQTGGHHNFEFPLQDRTKDANPG